MTLDGVAADEALVQAAFVATAGLAHVLTWRHHERAGAQAEHALSATGEGIYGIDERGHITFANPAAARALGCEVVDLLGRHHHEAFGHALAGGEHPAVDECATCIVVEAHTGTPVRDHLFGTTAGCGFPVELAATPIELRGDVTGSMVAFRDITDHDELRRRAFTDPLTGLPNRMLLLEHLEETLGRRRRADAVAVLFLDLDRFKAVNDTHGHAAGDALLIGVADRLRQVVRPTDVIGRLGGDEFVVICEGVTDRDHAAGVAHRVLTGFDEPFDLGPEDLSIRPSIGVFVPEHDAPDTPEDFLRKADAAMYRAKQQGRGRVQLFDDGEPVAAAR
jgi:diguanylate cyclase (GGDEF)-like protein/PAS domain S-box-containing protein